MQNSDMEIAKRKLIEHNLTLVIVKEGKVLLQDKGHGVNGLLRAIKEVGKELEASSVADRIVGSAAAMLFVYSKIMAVFARTISDHAIQILEETCIAPQFETRVPHILNLDKKDVCPFEKLAMNSRDANEAYHKIREMAKNVVANITE